MLGPGISARDERGIGRPVERTYGKMTSLRFVVFGAGFWAPYQIAAWHEVQGAECVAIYNRTVCKAEKIAKRFDIPAVYAHPEELCSSAKNLISSISSPTAPPITHTC